MLLVLLQASEDVQQNERWWQQEGMRREGEGKRENRWLQIADKGRLLTFLGVFKAKADKYE